MAHVLGLLGEYKGTQTTSSPEEMMATVSLKDKWGMSYPGDERRKGMLPGIKMV